MDIFVSWGSIRENKQICNDGLDEVIDKLGGGGITLSQARKACKDGIIDLPDAIMVATTLQLPNWKLALGRTAAQSHSKAKDYYRDESIYLHNQKALEKGRLEDIVRPTAEAAVFWAVKDAWVDNRAVKAAWAAANTAWAIKAVDKSDREIINIVWIAAVEVVAAGVDEIHKLIDIYFDVLEENE